MKSSSPAGYTISPPKGILSVNWRELWRFRDVLLVPAWRDTSTRHKQTVLGIMWAALRPVATTVEFIVIFNRVEATFADTV